VSLRSTESVPFSERHLRGARRGGRSESLSHLWPREAAAARTLPLWPHGTAATRADLALVVYLGIFQLGLAFLALLCAASRGRRPSGRRSSF
jgi:hypothetical protein